MTVGELTTIHPRAVGVLHRHGIDFCCGGGRSLEEACAARGVDPAAVLAEVAAAERTTGAGIRWDLQPVEALIAHLLERYHAPLREDLELVVRLAQKVRRVHEQKDPRLVEVESLILALRDDLLAHLEKEEEVLFPWIRRPGAPPPEGPIEVMRSEHDEVADLLRRLERATDAYVVPEGACRSWTALLETTARVDRELREHVALENNVLFPRCGG
ncbi:MAG: iron-sulfur cluster repair di-iron protein [Myxococcota bacterium]